MTIKKLENGDLIHSVLNAFFHGGPVINLEPLNDYSACYFFRMNMIEEAIFNEFGRDRKARSVDVVAISAENIKFERIALIQD